jgi:hypothetical protein
MRLTVSVLALLLLVSGCSDESKETSDGSGSSTDAGTDTDAGPGAYGTPCTENESCASKLCFVEQGADSGVCTETCQQKSDCPAVEGTPFDCGELPGGEIDRRVHPGSRLLHGWQVRRGLQVHGAFR